MKVVLYLVTGTISLFLIFSVILQFPAVQTYVINTITSRIVSETGFGAHIERVKISWFDLAEFQDIVIYDLDSNKMIQATRVDIDFNVWDLIKDEVIQEDEISFDSARLYLTQNYPTDSTPVLNISQFLKGFNTTKEKQGRPITINKIELSNSHLHFDNREKEPIPAGFDINHFQLSNINTVVTNLKIENGIITANIDKTETREIRSEIEVREMTSNFLMDSVSMNFNNLSLKIGESHIQDTLKLLYRDPTAFKYFTDSVRIYANLNHSTIYGADIKKINPKAAFLPRKMDLSGIFDGVISSFSLNDFDIRFNNSSLRGDARFDGLPVVNETFLNIRLVNSRLVASDVQEVFGDESLLLEQLGSMSLDGRFIGYPNDFVANGDFGTSFGEVQSDLNLKFDSEGLPSYSGQLELIDFELGEYLQNPDLGQVQFEGLVKGTGFKTDQIDMYVQGEIGHLEIKGYDYKNIYSDGRIAENLFEGYLSIDDENLGFELNGKIDLKENEESVFITSNLNRINLLPLGLSDRDISASGIADVDFVGLDINDAQGNLLLRDLSLAVDGSLMELDSVLLENYIDASDSLRKVHVESDLANVELVGKFKAAEIYGQLEDLYLEMRNIYLDKDTSFVATPATSQLSFLEYDILIKDANSLINLWRPDINISANTLVEGDFATGESYVFNLSTHFDSLQLGSSYFINNQVDFNTAKMSDSEDILGMLYLQSENQRFSAVESQALFFESIISNDHIDFEANIRQDRFQNILNLNGNIDFFTDSTTVAIEDAELEALGQPWSVSKGNIVMVDSTIQFNNINAFSTSQGFNVNGAISKDSTELLVIKFDSLGLDNINSLINKTLDGKLDGEIALSNLYSNTRVESDLTVAGFSINSFLVGDVNGQISWDRNEELFDLNFSVMDNETKTMDLSGIYDPNREESLLIDADLVNAPVNLLEPFIEKYFSELSGTATGNFQIKGTPLNPKVFGKGVVNDGRMKINYLMTEYFVKGDFSFSEDDIVLDDIIINDKFGNSGTLTGSVNHGGFRNMSVDLLGDFTNIQVLNTSAQDNTLFYGQGFGSGTIQFEGPVNNLNITANARTDKGTRIFIPIGGLENVSTRDFISFTSFTDSTDIQEEIVEELDLKGVTLDLNIDVTNDAYCEIIFDIKAGDIIRGRGNGDLQLRIDTNGEFNMFGPLNIEQGWYNFTLYNIINKEFTIYPGGRITWYGDPYKGILDLDAGYKQAASLGPLLDPSYQETLEIKRKYPTEVLMNLDGPLLSPEISFDILASELPRNVNITGAGAGSVVDLDLEFQSFKNTIDEQELKRQVFSLIVLRKFSPPEAFNTGGAITNSVSELFSNQLSYWMSQVDENLEVDFDVDLTSFDQEAFNTFQLRLSYTFLDGRLRFTRDGNFLDNDQQVSINSLAGDWSVEYLLTADGRIKARMYNKNNYDNLYVPEGRNTQTTGFSLQYTQSFNEFFQEMNRIFQTRKKPKKPIEDPTLGEAILNEENEN